jgi:aspartate/methionine/tyrosine aminotransferase
MPSNDILSKRSTKINGQPMFEILSAAKELELQGKKIIHLEIGDSSPYGNNRIKELISKNLALENSLGYSPSEGESALRAAFADHYSILCKEKIESQNVVITPANAAISQLINVLSDDGDAILFPDPGFPTYTLAAEYHSIRPIFYNLKESNGFQINTDEINSIIASNRNIRAIFINNPSNPLGIFHQISKLNEIISFCYEKKISVVIDDTYRNLVYEENYPRVNHLPNVFYIYSLSKDIASPGMRIGCVIGDMEVIKKIATLNSLLYSCLPKFIQLAAAEYLNEDHRPYRIKLRADLRSRIKKVSAILDTAKGLTYVEPNSGIYFFLNISATNFDGDTFSHILLNEAGVITCPGSSFGVNGKKYIRICISGSEAELYEACSKISVIFNRYTF